MNNEKSLQLLPGLDVLKFILAILIVAGHCSLFEEYPNVFELQNRLNSIAVPIFFATSAYLFLRKFYNSPSCNTREMILHTIKRLSILFFLWYLLMLPMTYFKWFSIATLKETVFAILFHCTFSGYWFIKALLINTIIVWFCREKKCLLFCTTIALVVHLFFSYNYIYGYWPVGISLRPYYSFYYHTVYFCVGALLALYQEKWHFERWSVGLLLFLWGFLYIADFITGVDPLFRLFSILFVFPVFFRIMSMKPSTCKNFRSISVILYMVQFVLIWLYDGVCNIWLNPESFIYSVLQNSICRFFAVLSVASVISWLILRFEKNPSFAFLRYLH